MSRGGRRPGRRAGSSTSREEILTAARALLAEQGADATSVRQVAERAGVDAALVSYFFGSKQGLLDAAVELPFEPAAVLPGILGGPPERIGERLARFVLGALDDEEARGRVVGLVRSAARDNAAALVVRERLTRDLLEPIAAHLGGEDAPLRAALAMSQVAGFTLARHVVGLEPLTAADHERLVHALGSVLQRHLAGDW